MKVPHAFPAIWALLLAGAVVTSCSRGRWKVCVTYTG
jgi:hypothetical protein